jgi:C4-dicarboxylate transporter DctM subunit
MVGHLTGGPALVGIITCMFFAAISGSGPATVAAIAGSIGIIIPPSIPIVTYGVVTGASIGALFMGGILAGIVVGLSLMIVAYIIARKRGYGGSL